MIICSICGHENLPGSLYCANCNSDIVIDERKPVTDFRVEKAILEDRLEDVGGEESLALEVSPNMSIKEVVNRMVKHHKCSVVILGPERSIEGIFTERSLLRRVCNKSPINVDKPISEAMLKSPVVLKKSDSVAFALHMMEVQGYSYAIIEDDPIRVINIRDLLQYIVELHPSLGGFDKVLNGFKVATFESPDFSEEVQETLTQIRNKKDIVFKAFSAARKTGKLGETERINRETFLKSYIPAVKEVVKEKTIVSPDEAALLEKFVKLVERRKDYFLSKE